MSYHNLPYTQPQTVSETASQNVKSSVIELSSVKDQIEAP